MSRLFIILLSVGILLSCKEEGGAGATLRIAISPVDNALPVAMGESIAAADGRRFLLNTFRFYMSDISAVKSTGATVILRDAFLYKWGSAESLTLDIPPGSYDSIFFGLGLTPEQNLSNPSAFENSHPLSIAQDMYWPMLNYRFVLMEGAVDTALDKTGPVNFPTAYHLGSDILYRRVAIPWMVVIEEGDNPELILPVELKAIFNGPGGVIDMRTHFSNHTTDLTKAVIMVDNLAAALQ